MKTSILAFLFALVFTPSYGQSVQQSGFITPGHAACWAITGVIFDCGSPGGGVSVVGSTTTNDFVAFNASGSLIDSGINPTATSAWSGLQNFNGGATAPTRAPRDNSTNVATTAFVNSIIATAGCSAANALGFIADGATDNLAAWNNWVASLGSSPGCLLFGAGSYRFSAQAAATLSANQTIVVSGAGQDATEIWFAAGNGLVLTMNASTPIGFINSSSTIIANAAITTSQAGGVSGIIINGNTTNGYIPRQTTISNISLRGHVATGWWATNIALTDLSDVVVSNVGIYGLNNTNTNGTGISYVGTGAGTTPTLLNVNNLIAFFLNTGISASGSWQGLNVSQANIVDVTTGVSCTATSLQPECNIYNSQMNTARHAVVYHNIQTSSVSNNLFYQGAYTGLVNGDAIILQDTGSNNNIANNAFSAFTLGGATPNCIDISGGGSPVNDVVVSGNTFAGCTTNVIAGNSSNTMVIGNINATGTPFTGGGSFFAYLGTTIMSFPAANMTIGGTAAITGALSTSASITAVGNISILTGAAVPAGGAAGSGYLLSSTPNLGLFFGSGTPTLTAAQGSLYMRTDGLPYYNTNGTTGWGSLAPTASPTFTGTVTLPDASAWTSSLLTAVNITMTGQLRSTFGATSIASGACGATTNGTVAGTNASGLITIGGATTTTCTVSFSTTITAPGACVIFPANATAAAQGTTLARVSSVGTTNFVITGSALVSSNYYYICL